MAYGAYLKVCFGDIDNAGIVYYPRFVHYFHVALEEFFSNYLEIDYSTVINEHKIAFPTVHLESDFKMRLKFGDKLIVHVRVLRLGQTSITWHYKVLRTYDLYSIVAEGKNVTVCIDIDTFKKKTIPEWLLNKLVEYQKNQDLEGPKAV